MLYVTRAKWEDAVAFKPNVGVRVHLWRAYTPPMVPKYQTGFRSYGFWDGTAWRDLVFGGAVSDVKFFHELPALPSGEKGDEETVIDEETGESRLGDRR